MVKVSRAIYEAMLAHVQAGYPNEACGILGGNAEGTAVLTHFPARNAAADDGGDPHTFSIIAGPELLKIVNTIYDADGSVLVYYHSHPVTQAYPSPRDIQYANNWPGTYYFIFSLADRTQPIMRAFLISGDVVKEEAVVIAE